MKPAKNAGKRLADLFEEQKVPAAQKGRTYTAIKNIAMRLFLLVLTAVGGTALADKPAQVLSGVVTRVVDGDTLWVQAREGAGLVKVRLSGLDAPEICQAGGPAAREALRQRALGQGVTLTYRRRDDYGRVLARVDLQGEDLGRWMVAQGHAWSDGFRRHPGPYAKEQAQAASSRAGLFAQASPESPRSFRKRHGSCYP